MYLGRAMACLRSKKLSTPALNATSLREIEDLLQVAEIQKMVRLFNYIPIFIVYLIDFFKLDIGFVVIESS